MTENNLIQKTADYVRREFADDASGHDWFHIERVWKTAAALCEIEKADSLITQLAALLHDLDDWKFNESEEPLRARRWLESCAVEPALADSVCAIVKRVSYKGAGVADEMDSLEGKIVQDADRLDAIGAIGIARAFAYGGYKNRALYNPNSAPHMHANFEDYKKSKSDTINHFYEKLLLLKERMNTQSAKRIAEERHRVMENFLDQFMKEWKGADIQ
ncbi:MAG: HD domain-containing protein [Anaerolineales bacterium]|nr:HD domain-containing protein [Anaerolineales bacterium]